MNASATPADRTRALQQLYELRMHDREAIINFVSRFRSQIQVLSNTTSDTRDMPSDKELATFFIEKLCANAHIEGDVRHELLDCKKELHHPNSQLTLTDFEDQLCLAESQVYRGDTRRSHARTTGRSGTSTTCGFCGKRGHTTTECYSNPQNRSRHHQANHAKTQPGRGGGRNLNHSGRGCGGGRRHPITCFKCGGSHSLSACRHATPEERERLERERLDREKLGPRSGSESSQGRGNGRGHTPRPSPSQQVNQAINAPPSTSISQPTEQANTARVLNAGRPSRTGISWAQANYVAIAPDPAHAPMPPANNLPNSTQSHDNLPSEDDSPLNNEFALLAATPREEPLIDFAMNAMLQTNDARLHDPQFTLLSDWLTDSGASSYMTNDESDLVLNVEESLAVVQVANGVLIRAQLRGTVRIRIQDLNDPHISCDILVHDVLYVPGLSRRLLSVDQWNAAGGEIWFHPDHTTLRAVDSDTGEAQSFSVAKPFALLRNFDSLPSATSQTESTRPPRNTQQEAHASIQSAAAVVKKNAICSDLLHRRLGHRTVSTIMSGSHNEAWADTTMRWEGDDFCDSRKIVTARLANRGKSPLTENMTPGEYIMCDIVPNFNKRGLTSKSHFPYCLLVTDVKSRFTAPIGVQGASSKHIVEALCTWSRDYGPDVTFNLCNVLKLRGDAACTNFATELTELLTEHKIKGIFAAPPHQAQNGICERAWQSIREIAFKMMVHAHVPDEFYDFALEHTWKVFHCLPIGDPELNGKPCTPIESCTGDKPHLARFRVLFCPCVLGIGQADQGRGPIIRRNNCPERGLRGIHVDTPCHQDGWLCHLPTTGGLRVSPDVENFFSTTAHAPSKSNTRFPGSQKNSMQISLPMIPTDGDLEHTGDAWPFTSAVGGLTDPSTPALTRFAQLGVNELHDEDDPTSHPFSLATHFLQTTAPVMMTAAQATTAVHRFSTTITTCYFPRTLRNSAQAPRPDAPSFSQPPKHLLTSHKTPPTMASVAHNVLAKPPIAALRSTLSASTPPASNCNDMPQCTLPQSDNH
jgi:hypothetical protein